MVFTHLVPRQRGIPGGRLIRQGPRRPPRCGSVEALQHHEMAVSELRRQFEELGENVTRLIGLLEESEDPFSIPYLRRGLAQVRENRLSGATFILGCFGGHETFSDLVIGRHFETSDPLKFRNLNARLDHLRTRTFESANAITSRRAW